MKKKIGKVTLDYSYYTGSDLYSDGSIEDTLLEAYKSNTAKELLYSSNEWAVLYHVSDIRENILEWYPIENDADVLEIGSGCGAITGLLSRKAASVTCIELSEKRSMINAYRNKECENVNIFVGNFQDIECNLDKKYDYITLIGVWEYSSLYIKSNQPFHEMIRICQKHLKKDGKIIIAIENKMGLKYWNGALEDHTGKLYGGLNDYIGIEDVRTFSKQEIEEILVETRIEKYCFYYPVPDYKLPERIYTEKKMPNPGDIRYYKNNYDTYRFYNFYEATVYDQICKDNMFSYFSNSYLVVCGEKNEQCLFSTFSRERKKQYRIKTVLLEEGIEKKIVKKALNHESIEHIRQLKINEEKWKGTLSGIKYVNGELNGDIYISPFICGTQLDVYLYKWRNDANIFVEKVLYIIKKYLSIDEVDMIPFRPTRQFEEIFGSSYPTDQKSLLVTNIDLLFSNLMLTETEEIFNFDYEWIFDFPIPYEYVLWRSLEQLYNIYMIYLRNKISRDEFCEKAGISLHNLSVYRKMERHFAQYVTGEKCCERYKEKYRKHIINHSVNLI